MNLSIATPHVVDGLLKQKGYRKHSRPFSAQTLIVQEIMPSAKLVVWLRETRYPALYGHNHSKMTTQDIVKHLKILVNYVNYIFLGKLQYM